MGRADDAHYFIPQSDVMVTAGGDKTESTPRNYAINVAWSHTVQRIINT